VDLWSGPGESEGVASYDWRNDAREGGAGAMWASGIGCDDWNETSEEIGLWVTTPRRQAQVNSKINFSLLGERLF
jgi:hypothetical protein